MKSLSFDNELPNSNWKIEPKRFLLYFLISIFFAVLQIQQSLNQGQLSLPPSYDDVSYFNDALSRLKIFYDQGFRGLISNYVVNPPHSFVSTFLAFIGFAIFGIQEWVPSFMNFIIIFAVLIFLDYSTRGLNFLWKIVITIISLTWLLMGHAIIEFRPDIFCALLTAISVILITEKSWLTISQNRQKVIGVLFGLALITKPSIFPLTFFLIILAISFNILLDKIPFKLKFQLNFNDVFVKNKYFLLSSLLVASIYYPFGILRTLTYIHKTQSNDVWMHPMPLVEKMSYYISGQGGMMMTKNWLYLWIVLAVFALVIRVIKKKWRKIIYIFLLSFVIMFAFGIVTIADHKTPFIGVIVSCFLFLTSIKMLAFILDYSCRSRVFVKRLLIGFTLSFTVVSVILFEWPAPNDLVAPNPNTISERRYYNNLLVEIYKDIISSTNLKASESFTSSKAIASNPEKIYLSSMAHWLHRDSLQYYQYKLGMNSFIFSDGVLVDDLGEQINEINQANYVLAFSTPSPDTPDWLPSVKIEKKVIDFLNQSPNFKRLHTYTNPYTKANIYLYKKI
jgi:hypothetical protein